MKLSKNHNRQILKSIFLLFLGSILLFSQPLRFSNEELKLLETLPNKSQVFTRLDNLKFLIEEVKNYDIDKQLNRVNSFVNRIISARDFKSGEQTDIWATPTEFLISGRGDCEDYAILKYFSLLEIGVQKDKLWLAVVKTKNTVEYHMVLLYFENIKLPPKVLDNLSWKILPFNQRSDLKPVFIFNENEAKLLINSTIANQIKYPKEIKQKFKNLIIKTLNN